MVGVRDSKDQSGPTLTFTRDEWDAFLSGVHNGEFNRPRIARRDRVGSQNSWRNLKRMTAAWRFRHDSEIPLPPLAGWRMIFAVAAYKGRVGLSYAW